IQRISRLPRFLAPQVARVRTADGVARERAENLGASRRRKSRSQQGFPVDRTHVISITYASDSCRLTFGHLDARPDCGGPLPGSGDLDGYFCVGKETNPELSRTVRGFIARASPWRQQDGFDPFRGRVRRDRDANGFHSCPLLAELAG